MCGQIDTKRSYEGYKVKISSNLANWDEIIRYFSLFEKDQLFI